MNFSLRLFRFLSIVFFVSLIGIFSVKTLFATSFTFSGTVTDSSSVAVENAVIEALVPGTNTVVETTTTNSSGSYSLPIEEGVYDIKVTPPSGSTLTPILAVSRSISSDTITNFVFVPNGQVTLSGYMYDSLGEITPGVPIRIETNPGHYEVATTTTDSTGYYSFTLSPGTYGIMINGGGNTQNVAPRFQIGVTGGFNLSQSTIMDFTVPSKRVEIKVEDSTGNPIEGVTLSTNGGYSTGGITISPNITNGYGSSAYDTGTLPVTNSSGIAVLWLVSNTTGPYNITATPQTGSIYLLKTITPIHIYSDTSITMVMEEPVTLSGVIRNSLLEPIPNVVFALILRPGNAIVAQTTTDSNGYYSVTASKGDYAIKIDGMNNTGNLPLVFQAGTGIFNTSYQLAEDTLLDITLPFKRIEVHVEDINGTRISNAQIKTNNGYSIGGLTISPTITDANGASAYDPAFGTLPLTDGNGESVLWLIPNTASAYNITVTPPSGSPYLPKTVTPFHASEDMTLTIVLEEPVTLSGVIKNSLLEPIPNVIFALILRPGNAIVTQAITDSNGYYSVTASKGDYAIKIDGMNNTGNLPLVFQLGTGIFNSAYQLTANTQLDITVPLKKVDIHVQNSLGMPLENIELKTNNAYSTGGLTIAPTITDANGSSAYDPAFGTLPKTNSNGDVTLWLIPNYFGPYIVTATPPTASQYNSFILNNVYINQDQSMVISLQFSHPAPVTTVTLDTETSPNIYSDPTVVTLNATADSGYQVANTYYTIDGGAQQIYSVPFEVTTNGEHTITYWSVDNSGVIEQTNTRTFTIYENPGPFTLLPTGDTFIKKTHQNRNEGSAPSIRINDLENVTRGLIKFDQTQIAEAVEDPQNFTAKLSLTVNSNDGNWGANGRKIYLHKMNLDWTEGNGHLAGNPLSDFGTGNGATWDCASDTDISNDTKECSTENSWKMTTGLYWPFEETESGWVQITSGFTGVIEFDVTEDVQDFLNGTGNFGWLLKKYNENTPGQIRIGSKDSQSPPTLIITNN